MSDHIEIRISDAHARTPIVGGVWQQNAGCNDLHSHFLLAHVPCDPLDAAPH